MATILLARHGESDWNAVQRWQGHADRLLTERGRTQAEALADRLEEVDLSAIYASDLARARETARAVAARKGFGVIVRSDLREVDVGSWSGLTRSEVESREPDGVRCWAEGGKGWQGGESYEEMSSRVVAAVNEIAAAHPGEHVLVVSHGGCVRALHAHALGLTFHAHRKSAPVEPNARLSAILVEDGAFELLHVDDLSLFRPGSAAL